jgi:uncharacterized membrane protein YidH (DUF202 family)
MVYFAVGAFFIVLGIVIVIFRQRMSQVGRQTPPAANFVGGVFLVLVGIGAILTGLQHH